MSAAKEREKGQGKRWVEEEEERTIMEKEERDKGRDSITNLFVTIFYSRV